MLPHRCLRLAQRIFDDEALGRVFEPMIADWQRSPRDLRWLFAFGIAAAHCLVRGNLRRSDVAYSCTAAAVFTVVFGSVASGLYIYSFDGRYFAAAPWAAPGFLTGAFAASVLPAAFVLGYRGASSRTLASLVVVWTLVTTTSLGWLVPATNQHYRVIARSIDQPGVDGVLARGTRELPLHNLLVTEAATRRAPGTQLQQIALERHTRLTACLAPVALAPFGFALGVLRRRIAPTCGVAWWTAIVLAGFTLQARGFSAPIADLDPAFGYWGMFALIAVTGVVVTGRLSRDGNTIA